MFFCFFRLHWMCKTEFIRTFDHFSQKTILREIFEIDQVDTPNRQKSTLRVKSFSWLLHAFFLLDLVFLGQAAGLRGLDFLALGGQSKKRRSAPKALLEQIGVIWSFLGGRLGTKSMKKSSRALLKQQFYHGNTSMFEKHRCFFVFFDYIGCAKSNLLERQTIFLRKRSFERYSKSTNSTLRISCVFLVGKWLLPTRLCASGATKQIAQKRPKSLSGKIWYNLELLDDRFGHKKHEHVVTCASETTVLSLGKIYFQTNQRFFVFV